MEISLFGWSGEPWSSSNASSSIRSLSLLISFSLSLEICPSSSSASASASAAKKATIIWNDYNAICCVCLFINSVIQMSQFFCRFQKGFCCFQRSNVPFLQELARRGALMLAILYICCCRFLLPLFFVSEKDFKEAVLTCTRKEYGATVVCLRPANVTNVPVCIYLPTHFLHFDFALAISVWALFIHNVISSYIANKSILILPQIHLKPEVTSTVRDCNSFWAP